jgi:hypothetical protein
LINLVKLRSWVRGEQNSTLAIRARQHSFVRRARPALGDILDVMPASAKPVYDRTVDAFVGDELQRSSSSSISTPRWRASRI